MPDVQNIGRSLPKWTLQGLEPPGTREEYTKHERSFVRWIKAQGAYVYPSADNLYVLRFLTSRGSSVVLGMAGGELRWFGEAEAAWNAYRDQSRRWMGCTGEERGRLLRALAARDGWECFYCATGLERYTATLEHLVPLSAAGSWEIGNLVLACAHCNTAAGTLPVVGKVRLREALRADKHA